MSVGSTSVVYFHVQSQLLCFCLDGVSTVAFRPSERDSPNIEFQKVEPGSIWMPLSCVEEQIEPFILHSTGRSQVEKSSHLLLPVYHSSWIKPWIVVWSCAPSVVSHTYSQMNCHSDIYLRGSLSIQSLRLSGAEGSTDGQFPDQSHDKKLRFIKLMRQMIKTFFGYNLFDLLWTRIQL